MKIKRIEYENFRNFRNHGEIRCSTDGNVTIIYGKNGDGKTTLHQLLQWVFYGKVHFNRTTTDRLYNLAYEYECSYGDTFIVMGRIDFEQNGEEYSLTRINKYKKGLDESTLIQEDFSLLKMSEDHDWKRLDNPKETIEKFLPSGLAEYFFFDGESMIADLRVKGRDSASKLRKAMYSMFDLDILEQAITHIGSTHLKTTVLGKLYLTKSPIAGGGEVSQIKANIEATQSKISTIDEQIERANEEKTKKNEFIQRVSEEIGNTKSKTEYERRRKELQKHRDSFLDNANACQANFGDAVIEMFPKLFVSKTVADSKKKIHLEIENNYLPPGVGKDLVEYLLKPATTVCICGTPLNEKSIEQIKAYKSMLPPDSYTSSYNNFADLASSWGKEYNRTRIENYISLVLKNRDSARECDAQIHELDEEEKKSKDIEDLVVDRQKAEDRVAELDDKIEKLVSERDKFEIYLKSKMKDYDKATEATEENLRAARKIKIVEEVLENFSSRLAYKSKEYSESLQENIQALLNDMLTSKRTVSVSEDFAVRVTDSYDDESKSEGQFAVVSFAYIGGILRMLQSEEKLSGKEYPLVLDGPFSKLDPDQRRNVANLIPEFAPQVILFSKDDLQDVFRGDKIGNVWTISSNDEKNIAKVEEGYKW